MLRTADKMLMIGGFDPQPQLDGRLPPPTFVGGGGGIESITAAAIPSRHASTATGDIEIVVIETLQSQPGTISTAGWSQVPNSPQNAADTELAVWWHRYTAGDGLPTIDDAGDHMVAYIMAFRGAGLGGQDPFDATAGSTAAASTAVSFPTLSTTSWNCLIVHFCAIGRDANAGGAFTPWLTGNIAGFFLNDTMSVVTPIYDRTSAIGGGGGAIAGMGVKAQPGPIGTTTTVLATSQAQAMLTVALR